MTRIDIPLPYGWSSADVVDMRLLALTLTRDHSARALDRDCKRKAGDRISRDIAFGEAAMFQARAAQPA